MRIVKRIRGMSAQNQIVGIYGLFMFLSMVIMGTYLSCVLYSKSLEATNEKMTIYVDKTKENIEQMLTLVANTAHAVAASNSILSWIDNPDVFDKSETRYYQNINNMEKEVRYVLNYSNAWQADLIGFISIYVNDELISYTYAKPIPEKQIIKDANNAYKVVSEHSGSSYLSTFVEDDKLYYALKLKYDFNSDESLVILIASDESVLKKYYTGAIPSKDTKTYLTDNAGMIYSSSDESLNHQRCSSKILDYIKLDQMTTLSYEGQRYVAFAKKVYNDQFTFINLVPYSYITYQAFSELPLFIGLALVLCLLLLIIGLILSRKMTMFIRDLTGAMKSVERANYDVKMPHYKNKGVDDLGHAFNSMTTEMKHLIQTTYESKIMMQEMEFKSLQQQTNPHFLFNILLVIQIKAKMCADETVYHMLTSLSGLLRGSLYSNKNIYTTLEEEMKYVNFYLYLQQQRFGDKLHYEINIDESLKSHELPRLTVEPIVENAVIHGVENQSVHVSVVVNAFTLGEDMIIEVIDDGIGFDVSAVDLSREGVTDETSNREKIGLRNTHNRLKLLYGEDYGIQIQSKRLQGTKVVIRIPIA